MLLLIEMSDNKERIEPTESLHLYLALRRNKTNRDVANHRELCFHQVVRDEGIDLALLKLRISFHAGVWRIHRTVNPRNLKRARIWMMKHLIDTDGSYDYRIETLWKKALMNNPIKENILIDIDTKKPETINSVKEILRRNNVPIVEEIATPNGYHVVCPIFDTRLIQEMEDVGYTRDGFVFVEEIRID